MITYRIDATDVRAHLYRITLDHLAPATEQRLSLPVWIPGSYLVREFARHLSALTVQQGDRALELEQLGQGELARRAPTVTPS
jgi:predicted metalloprotease with PDZ domain